MWSLSLGSKRLRTCFLDVGAEGKCQHASLCRRTFGYVIYILLVFLFLDLGLCRIETLNIVLEGSRAAFGFKIVVLAFLTFAWIASAAYCCGIICLGVGKRGAELFPDSAASSKDCDTRPSTPSPRRHIRGIMKSIKKLLRGKTAWEARFIGGSRRSWSRRERHGLQHVSARTCWQIRHCRFMWLPGPRSRKRRRAPRPKHRARPQASSHVGAVPHPVDLHCPALRGGGAQQPDEQESAEKPSKEDAALAKKIRQILDGPKRNTSLHQAMWDLLEKEKPRTAHVHQSRWTKPGNDIKQQAEATVRPLRWGRRQQQWTEVSWQPRADDWASSRAGPVKIAKDTIDLSNMMDQAEGLSFSIPRSLMTLVRHLL